MCSEDLRRDRRYEGLKVGRNSDVEGLYEVEGLERLLHVEATGAFAASDTEKVGLRRSDSAHKINSKIRLVRDAALECGEQPPIPLVFTSHLAMSGTEAGGVVLALAAIDGVVVEVDDDGSIREVFSPADLRGLLMTPRKASGTMPTRVTPVRYGRGVRVGSVGTP